MGMTNVGKFVRVEKDLQPWYYRKITTAVLDTGIYAHPDFFIPRNKIVYFQDFIRNRKILMITDMGLMSVALSHPEEGLEMGAE